MKEKYEKLKAIYKSLPLDYKKMKKYELNYEIIL